MRDLLNPAKPAWFKFGTGDFPRFLWEGETLHEDPTIGFLAHPILFAVGPFIWFSIQH